MSWIQFSQQPPVPGKNFGPADLILAGWPQTATAAAFVAVMAAQDFLNAQAQQANPPSYWQPIDPTLPAFVPPAVTAAAQTAYLQQQIAAVQANGGDPALLQAILSSVQATAVPVGP